MDLAYRKDVLIDPAVEVVYPLKDMKKLISSKPTYETLVGWAKRGILNHETKQMVKLETIKLPLGRGTSVEAYQRFLVALNAKGT